MSVSGLLLRVGFAIESVREIQPVVHCVPPRAATALVADILEAAGAKPVVTGYSPPALAAMSTADAAYLDVSSFESEGIDTKLLSGLQLPWVLDVTSIGRAPVNAALAQTMAGFNPSVIRIRQHDVGLGLTAPALVVRSDTDETVQAGDTSMTMSRGAEMLKNLVGIRSVTSALTAACAAVTSPMEASLAAGAWLALASERAAERAPRPGSFKVALVDELATIRGDIVAESLMHS